MRYRATLPLAIAMSLAGAVAAEQLTSYGTPGIVEMPSGEMLPDGTIAITSTQFGATRRNSLTFQLAPRVQGVFRYSRLEDYFTGEPIPNRNNLYDRSFDVHLQLRPQQGVWPAIGLGLRDFAGTGVYGSEYIAATRTVGERMTVTAGLGWGRLASRGGFRNPLAVISDAFEDRPDSSAGGLAQTGKLDAKSWFRGPAAAFAGVRWMATDRLTLLAEYSSDSYDRERARGLVGRTEVYNFGAAYKVRDGLTFSAFSLGGQEVGVQLSYAFDPAKRPVPGLLDAAPPPLVPRGAARENLAHGLQAQGFRVDGHRIESDRATVWVENGGWDSSAQAAGRAARVLANALPPQVETFDIRFQHDGMPIARVTSQRKDLEELEFDLDGTWRARARAKIGDSTEAAPSPPPRVDAGLAPYLAASFFDPDSPVRFDAGIEAFARWRPASGLSFTGVLRYPLLGNLDESIRISESVLPHVRSDAAVYDRESDIELAQLTAAYLFRPTEYVFGRVTAGYLEAMYGGLSAELLWAPVDSRLSLGVEVNAVRQRDFDMRFGFRDYGTVTGHASAYWDFGGGYHGQLDLGRYLAKDWGGTVTLTREFGNGFRVGAFFTLTDVSFDDFGEGAFDKGITFDIPTSWLTGRSARRSLRQTIRPVLRDGGARLDVPGRLHEIVRDYRAAGFDRSWGRYLR